MDSNFRISSDGAFLYHHSLSSHKEIIHGFALREDPITGQERSYGLNGYQPDCQVWENRRYLIDSLLGIARSERVTDLRLVALKQTHSDEILIGEGLSFYEPPASGDGLLTGRPGLLLAVQTADCMPVLMLDPENMVVAAIHAGWRGTLKRILEKSVRKLHSRFGSDPAQCIGVVGPSICKCCYSVGQEVSSAFQAEFPYASALFATSREESRSRLKPGHFQEKLFLDLPLACKYQLLEVGFQETRIFADPPCTACDTRRFFSHRADAGHCGRMMSVIGICPPPRVCEEDPR